MFTQSQGQIRFRVYEPHTNIFIPVLHASQEVSPTHPLIYREGIVPYHAKQWHHYLIVPIVAEDSSLQGFQMFLDKEHREFYPGSRITGNCLELGACSRWVTLTDDYVAGCRARERGDDVVIAFELSNIPHIKNKLKSKHFGLQVRMLKGEHYV